MARASGQRRQFRVDAANARASNNAQARADRQSLAQGRLDLQRLRVTEKTAQVRARTESKFDARRDAIIGKAQAQRDRAVGVAAAKYGSSYLSTVAAADAAVAQADIGANSGLSGVLGSLGDALGGLGGSFGGGGGVSIAGDGGGGGGGAGAGVSPLVLIGVAIGVFLLLRR
ncbi:MAG TPA: hypothetical protein VEK85_17175 [Gemmatimonadales bacterium]|nr:hypothetical protein [Gemmatimonadales bacterium]